MLSRNKLFYKIPIVLMIYSYIITFCLWPLAVSAQPSPVTAQLTEKVKLPFTTSYYITKAGDTLTSLSKAKNISLMALSYLNKQLQIKDAKKPLSKGMRLVMPKGKLDARTSQKFDSQIKNEMELLLKQEASGKNSSTISGWLSRFASIFSSGKDTKAQLEDLGAQSVSSALNSTLSAWLNQYGTTKIDLNLNHHLGLDNANIMALFPVYDKNGHLLFTQGSVSRSDGRTQMNVGIGNRYFSSSSMVGLNSFLDYDMSGQHLRLGVGGEYWRNYLKIAANGYIGLTPFKESITLANVDYNAKAANGFDLNANAYIPFYPQLGLTACYEKYFGDEVDLFNNKAFAKNPSAYSLGVNYTPIPLITMGVDYKYGANQQSLARLGVEMTYRFGVPLKAQLDSTQIDGLRRLQGSRYEFVNRNNNIVLSYVKDPTEIVIKSSITGHNGEIYHLFDKAQLSKRWAIKAWDNPSKLQLSSACYHENSLANCEIILPPCQKGDDIVNTYPLALTVHQPITGKTQILTSHVTVQPYDNFLEIQENINGEPQSHKPVFIKALLNAKEWELKKWQTSNGFVEAGGSLSPECQNIETLQACKVTLPKARAMERDNMYDVSLTVYDKIANEDKLVYTHLHIDTGAFEESNLNLQVERDELAYHEQTKVTFTLLDNKKQPILVNKNDIKHYINLEAEKENGLPIAKEEGHFTSIVDQGNGVYTTNFVASDQDQILFLRGFYQGHSSNKVKIAIFDNKPDLMQTEFIVDKNETLSGGEIFLQLIAKNKNGKILKGLANKFSFDIKSIKVDGLKRDVSPYKITSIVEEEDGTYSARLMSDNPATYQVTPIVIDEAQMGKRDVLNEKTKQVIFKPKKYNSKNSVFKADDKELAPRGQDNKKEKTTLRFYAKDDDNKKITGLGDILNFAIADDSGEIVERFKPTESESGVYTAIFDIKQKDGYRLEGDYKFYIVYDNDLIVDLTTIVKVDPDLSIPAIDKSEFKLSRDVVMLDELSGYPAEIALTPRNKIGQDYDLSKVRLVLKTKDGQDVTKTAADLSPKPIQKNTQNFSLKALQTGEYRLVLQYLNVEGIYVDLAEKTIFFIDAMPSSFSKLSIDKTTLAVNNSANFDYKANIELEAYDIYHNPLDYAALSSDKKLAEKLTVVFANQAKGDNQKAIITLAQAEGNHYKGLLKADFVKKISPLGDQYQSTALYDQNPISIAAQVIEISPNMALPQKAFVHKYDPEIIFNRGDKDKKLIFEYQTLEKFKQGDIDAHLQYRVFKDGESLGGVLLKIEKNPNDLSQYFITFTPKEEGQYVIESYYSIYGLLDTEVCTPARAVIDVMKGKKDYDINVSKTELSVNPEEIATDDENGKLDQSEISLKVINKDQKPAIGLCDILSFDIYDKNNKLIDNLPAEKEKEKGIYTAIFKVFDKGVLKPEGSYTITPKYKADGISELKKTIKISAYYAKPNKSKSSLDLSSSRSIIKAQGGVPIVATVSLYDMHGNLIQEKNGKTYYPYELVLMDKKGVIDKNSALISKLSIGNKKATAQFNISGLKEGSYDLALRIAQTALGNDFTDFIKKPIEFSKIVPGNKTRAVLKDSKIYVENLTKFGPTETKMDLYLNDDKGQPIISDGVLNKLTVVGEYGKSPLGKVIGTSKNIIWEKGTNHYSITLNAKLNQGFSRIGIYNLNWQFADQILPGTKAKLEVMPVENRLPEPRSTILDVKKQSNGDFKITFTPRDQKAQPMYDISYNLEIYTTRDKSVCDVLIAKGEDFVKKEHENGTAVYTLTLKPKISTSNGYYILKVTYLYQYRYAYDLVALLFNKGEYVKNLMQ